MNNNGDGKIPMIGQEKRDKWKKILPELLAVILCLVLMGAGVSRKEGYHMDELLSFELANARYNPWIVPTQPEGRLAKFVNEEIEGDSAGETLENLKNTVTDVLRNRGNSKLLSYKADVYEEPVWITDRQFQDYVTVDQKDAFDYLSVYFNVKDDNHPPVHFYAVAYHEFCLSGNIVTVAWMQHQSGLSGNYIVAFTAARETAGRCVFPGRKGKTAGDPGGASLWNEYRSTGYGAADPYVWAAFLSVCRPVFRSCGKMEE